MINSLIKIENTDDVVLVFIFVGVLIVLIANVAWGLFVRHLINNYIESFDKRMEARDKVFELQLGVCITIACLTIIMIIINKAIPYSVYPINW